MNHTSFSYGDTEVVVHQGDITKVEADVIVNAANSSLLGGGGVDGAIHRAAGPALLDACRDVRARQGKCRTGEAVITPAGNLRAKHVVHTVGPVWRGGDSGEEAQLGSCYTQSMRLAHEHGAQSIAFPAISTGIYRFPFERAGAIALEAVLANLHGMARVTFVLFGERDYETFLSLLQAHPDLVSVAEA